MRAPHGLEKEKFLFNSFQKFSKRIFQERESEWETLFEMQHYGIPTRLIDWSETFGIALFFAAYYQKSDDGLKDAAIYLLNPNTLNQISGVPQVYRLPKDEKNFSYTGIYWDHRPFAPVAPIAIEPNFINDRMLAQRGMFTVHSDSSEPIEMRFPQAIKKVVLPHAVIPAALEFLGLANITSFSVFPDLAGIARFLIRSAGFDR